MTATSHEFGTGEDPLYDKILLDVVKELRVDSDHPHAALLAQTRYENILLSQTLTETQKILEAAEETIRQKDGQLEELIYDPNTGLLLFGPAIRKSRLALVEIDRNISEPGDNALELPNAAATLVIDVEALHVINNRRGHPAGDSTIGAAGEALVDTADYLRTSFRSHDRRENPWRRGDISRPADIIGRREKGDELFALLPFVKTDEFSEVRMIELIEGRLSSAKKDNGEKKLYLHWGVAFYEPGKTMEQLLEEADPKVTSRIQRIGRSSRKIGRAILGKY